jgi:tight adherence protein C
MIFLAVLVVIGTLVIGASEPQGVARSLAIIERQITHNEVGKDELPARDRLVTPVFDRFRRIGLVFSPRGTSDRLARMLDVAGNPPDWPVERVLGAKGVSMIVFAVIGLLMGGLSLTG